jgi:hypothetical protein
LKGVWTLLGVVRAPKSLAQKLYFLSTSDVIKSAGRQICLFSGTDLFLCAYTSVRNNSAPYELFFNIICKNIKTQREFWEAFFSAIFLTHENQLRSRFWHFLTDKGPNMVIRYDFWTTNIFTSLKNCNFSDFVVRSFGVYCGQDFFYTTNYDKKIIFRLF